MSEWKLKEQQRIGGETPRPGDGPQRMVHAEEHHNHHRRDSCDEQAMAKHSITGRDNCATRSRGEDHSPYTQAAARVIPRHLSNVNGPGAWNLKLSCREIKFHAPG